MKIGKIMLSVAGATAAVCSAFAFKAESKNPGHLRLYAKETPEADCLVQNVWTDPSGIPAPTNQYYTDVQCDQFYNGNITFVN